LFNPINSRNQEIQHTYKNSTTTHKDNIIFLEGTLAEAYKEVPKTTTPPTFSETKLVLGDEKEVVAARVDFVYPYHRWFSDAGWGTLMAFGGVLRPRTGTAALPAAM
jgi:hypothetical protein